MIVALRTDFFFSTRLIGLLPSASRNLTFRIIALMMARPIARGGFGPEACATPTKASRPDRFTGSTLTCPATRWWRGITLPMAFPLAPIAPRCSMPTADAGLFGRGTSTRLIVRCRVDACSSNAGEARVCRTALLWIVMEGIGLTQPPSGRVVRYDPTGRVDRILVMPVSQPTCVALGGSRIDTPFITSARYGMSPGAL
jgi:hypothetical protein